MQCISLPNPADLLIPIQDVIHGDIIPKTKMKWSAPKRSCGRSIHIMSELLDLRIETWVETHIQYSKLSFPSIYCYMRIYRFSLDLPSAISGGKPRHILHSQVDRKHVFHKSFSLKRIFRVIKSPFQQKWLWRVYKKLLGWRMS